MRYVPTNRSEIMSRLFLRLWSDDGGAVLTTEYLALGSIVALGTTSGLSAMRDSVNDECRDFGHAVHQVAQTHRAPVTGESTHRATKGDQSRDGNQSPIFMTP
jgi:hypothetical protein